jgi:hypothetical protein
VQAAAVNPYSTGKAIRDSNGHDGIAVFTNFNRHISHRHRNGSLPINHLDSVGMAQGRVDSPTPLQSYVTTDSFIAEAFPDSGSSFPSLS